MTKQEFEYHIDQIIIDAYTIVQHAYKVEIVEAHQKSMQFHRDKLKEFYDSQYVEEKPETLQYLENRKEDIEFHMGWNCSSDSFEYECYKEELLEVQKKIEAFNKEETE